MSLFYTSLLYFFLQLFPLAGATPPNGVFLHDDIFPSPRMNFLHLADGELLGDFSLEILEVEFDLAHVLLYVARGMEGLGRDDQFLLVVDGVEDDGEAGFLGDKVKAFLPVGIERTGALGGDADLNRSAWRADSARRSVREERRSRQTGMPPRWRKRGPRGQKNHSRFMRKLLQMPSARE